MSEVRDSADGWLIRDNGNRIRGPFKQSEIVNLIKKGQLKGKTEISRANSYWFAIEEKAELGKFFPEFNGGRPAAEQPTQMTATLINNDDPAVEATQFVAVQANKDAAPDPDASADGEKIEWLSDELAHEFGDDFGATLSVQTDVSAEQPTPAPSAEDKAREEIMKRATVKADTLPSEHKSFQGDRPKPIDTLMRARGGGSANTGQPSSLVNVPVEPEPAPKMFIEESEAKVRERSRKRKIYAACAFAVLTVAGTGAALYFTRDQHKWGERPAIVQPVRKGGEASAAVRQSIILFDLEGAKSALYDLEQDPASRGDANLFFAQAIVKKEFLYDVEGAANSLQTAKSMAKNKRTEAELDNLLAVYSFDRDAATSLELLRRTQDANRDEPVFRYNFALGLLRSGRAQDAIPILDSMLSQPMSDQSLAEDSATALGWAIERTCSGGGRDPVCRRNSDAEDAFRRALQANPNSDKARLGLALFRLRRGGFKAAENDFRIFLDSAPDLDPPSRISNFRKLPNASFYDFAHSQIVDLSTPGQGMSKASPMIMAADALISGMQLKTSEAGKILDSALTSAPGDPNVLKASGYLRWKDGRLNELVDTLKDLKERNSFAVNLMLGKSYFKLQNRALAEKHYRALVEAFPARSEGHSLLGELLLEQPGKADEAKAQFQLALKKDPLDLVAWRGLQRAGAPIVLSPEIQKNLPF